MYAVMRRIKVQPHLIDMLVERTERNYVPVLKNEPGFIEFSVVRVGENEAVSISIFESREEAEEGNVKALEWAREQIFPLAEGPAEMVGVGEILLHQAKESGGARGIS